MTKVFGKLRRALQAITSHGAVGQAGKSSSSGILLVEDEARVRRLLRNRLTDAGYRVVEAGTAAEALEAVKSQVPDLVITDLRLPDVSGTELIGRLRKRHPALRVIAIAGDPQSDVPASLREAQQRGAVRTLPKPFTTQQLLEAVSAALLM